MMKLYKLIALVAVGLSFVTNSYGARVEWKSKVDSKPSEEKAMACAPATELVLMNYNNVRALIETGGSMWQDRATSRAFYRIPAEGNLSVIYAGALWLGGISPDQQLKLAAVTFRADGNDFWPGPLTIDGAAEIDQETCQDYDKFFLTERQWSEEHRAYYDCENDPTCNTAELFPDGYVTPAEFYSYPAHGNPALNQDFYLAPFFDYAPDGEEGDGLYNPDDGDYPWYDLTQEVDCENKSREDVVPLFGDQNYWWVFNDKGNVHSETNGEPIGMEIRAQAFAFATNDEVNNMTFYNYVLINRGTTELGQTYFGQWVDADLGTSSDDYVGCDVQRGLGYCYNGDAFDESSTSSDGYGDNPPAVGVDFFEGPYQDYDGIDNPGPISNLFPISYQEAVAGNGIPYKGLGIGYGDGNPDNERFGMRKFLYYNIGGGQNGDPETALDHYNYLIGIWKNGLPMTYGGDGFQTGNNPNQLADFMFPGDTDNPSTGGVGFGTGGNIQEPWDEITAGNNPGDRRFIQSAGPFSLQPGDYNNVTVGVVYGRALSGDQFESVNVLRIADDKAQALFDNCFEIVSGPDAPDVSVQELDQEVILYLTNDNNGNNREESFGPLSETGFDPGIPEFDSQGNLLSTEDRSYVFQGYQIYQLANSQVTVTDLNDLDNARLIKTMDIQDDVTTLINWDLDSEIGEVVPSGKAFGTNSGIEHSISITEDVFATGSDALINYKTYYFMVLAYGSNTYEPYDPVLGTGQDETYKASRKAGSGGEVRVIKVIPHPVTTEDNGTLIAANYGDGIKLTRHEGIGHGTNRLNLDPATEAQIMSGSPWKVSETTYSADGGPVQVKVIDPLALRNAEFELSLGFEDQDLDVAPWKLVINDENGETLIFSDKAIDVLNEQLILDYGISIAWQQYENPYPDQTSFAEPLEATVEFSDPTLPWLFGFPDDDGFTEFNWIRSGTQLTDIDPAPPTEEPFDDYTDIDNEEDYEGLLGGTVAPYVLTSYSATVDGQGTLINVAPAHESYAGSSFSIISKNNLSTINNVDIVLTPNRDLWTRCPVLEMQWNQNFIQTVPFGNYEYLSDGEKCRTRRHPSVDKHGRSVGDDGYNASEAELNGHREGMGWFPGYAIDVGTGERLNMAFGEDSWLGTENGRDMIWNPTSTFVGPGGDTYAGGQHWVYVFKNTQCFENDPDLQPGYDEGKWLYNNLVADDERRDVFRSCTWVASAIVTPGFELASMDDGLVPTETRVQMRAAKEYQKFSATCADFEETTDGSENLWNPYYTFETSSISVRQEQLDVLEDALADINVVPNPYYAFSTYEEGKIDNRIKITNLPFKCDISIYNLSGTLIRQYSKSEADPTTFLDWDLKNSRNIPIASGIYLIHVKTDAGERILKWFGVMRPIDLDNF